jgi:predicted dehydrogenase
VELAAIAEVDEARRTALARRHGIGLAVADWRLLVSSPRVDAVLILTPHDLHASMTVAALEAGKDVLCEKPMARTTRECDAMLEAAAGSGRRLYVTHTLRHDLFYLTAAARLREGALGRPLAASFRWFTDELERLEDPHHWKGTRNRSGGGVLIDGGCHVADLANALLGPARMVTALAGKLAARREAVGEDTAVFAVEYESGALASFLLSFTGGAAYRGAGSFGAGMLVDLYGSQAHLEGGYLLREGELRRWCTEHRAGVPDRTVDGGGLASAGDIDVALVKALRGEAPPPLTALEARNAVAVVEAAYQALASQRGAEVDWRTE